VLTSLKFEVYNKPNHGFMKKLSGKRQGKKYGRLREMAERARLGNIQNQRMGQTIGVWKKTGSYDH
jgi:hypothetical protein